MTTNSVARVTDLSQMTVGGAPAPYVPRRRTLQIGTAIMTAVSLMYFGGLFGIYVSSRKAFLALQQDAAAAGDRVAPWIPASADVELTAPTIMTWTLLMSTVTMQWAVYSFKRDDRRHGLLALATTAMFGAAVINQVVFQWKQLGLVIDQVGGSSAATLIYTITASHVAMVAIALCMLAFVAFRAFAGNRPSDHLDGVAAAATFWYAMVGLYFVIWILIFISK